MSWAGADFQVTSDVAIHHQALVNCSFSAMKTATG
jgi:hypothetical protein